MLSTEREGSHTRKGGSKIIKAFFISVTLRTLGGEKESRGKGRNLCGAQFCDFVAWNFILKGKGLALGDVD